MMGHCLFGARAVYGDILFLTVSPSERHSGLVLRLSRCRRNDPMLEADSTMKDIRRNICGQNMPSISRKDAMTIELPEYAARRKMNARDPHAVVSGFRVCIYVILPRCLGYRMCPMCPRCNVDGSESPCQDQFGSNARPMGGALGLCQAAGGAIEFQKHSTPHYHGNVHLSSAYQHKTLDAVGQLIEADLLSVDGIKEYQSWL